MGGLLAIAWPSRSFVLPQPIYQASRLAERRATPLAPWLGGRVDLQPYIEDRIVAGLGRPLRFGRQLGQPLIPRRVHGLLDLQQQRFQLLRPVDFADSWDGALYPACHPRPDRGSDDGGLLLLLLLAPSLARNAAFSASSAVTFSARASSCVTNLTISSMATSGPYR